MGVGSNFFETDSKGLGNKSENKQMGLRQTSELPHSKENHRHTKKAASGIGENIWKSCIR